MKKTENKTENKFFGSGLGLGTTVFIVLLILKIFKLINISWVWVFAPLWIPISMTLVVLFIIFICTLIIAIINGIEKKK